MIHKGINCTGCNACFCICPVGAISHYQDRGGFVYPRINKEACVQCGLCEKVCSDLEKLTKNIPIQTYVGRMENDKAIYKSSSGGIAYALGKTCVDKGGVVYGVGLTRKNGKNTVEHIAIDNKERLYEIQGSKYVQSELQDIFISVEKLLKDRKQVVFTGTPCQVAGLNVYLKNNYNNLVTIDVICHGVPSLKLFQDYINFKEKIKKRKITDFEFRNKEYGWDYIGKLKYFNRKKSIYFTSTESTYYDMFIKGVSYRECCYKCTYAAPERISDITIGDCWGIESKDLRTVSDPNIMKLGMSCILINTQSGLDFFNEAEKYIWKEEIPYTKIIEGNRQLKEPVKEPKLHLMAMEIYKKYGYEILDGWWKTQQYNDGKLKYILKKILPFNIRRHLKTRILK